MNLDLMLSLFFFLPSPDDWQFYPAYFDSLFHLIDQSWSPPAEGEQLVHNIHIINGFANQKYKKQKTQIYLQMTGFVKVAQFCLV